MQIRFSDHLPQADLPIAVPVVAGLGAVAPTLNLPETVEASSEVGRMTLLTGGVPGRSALLQALGLGNEKTVTPLSWRHWAAKALWSLAEAGQDSAAVIVPVLDGSPISTKEAAIAAAEGLCLAAHPHDVQRSSPPRGRLPLPSEITIVTPDPEAAAGGWEHAELGVNAICFARDLVNRTSGAKQPDLFVDALRPLEEAGLSLTVLETGALKKAGCGALLAVGQGSSVPPRLAILEWKGGGEAAPIALVGKGVTFDTGGISLKPPARMWEMQQDMAGAAAVAGAMLKLASQDAPVNAVGVLALAENAIGAAAYRPGDVLTTAKGLTVEVRDTDAEGRLVLADALAYTVKIHRPRMVIDIATLTGSVVAGLGLRFAGLFADDEVADLLMKTAKETGDALWRMPLDPYYRGKLASDIADVMQVGPDAERGDCCFGAAFLKEFAGDVPFAHIDTGERIWARTAQDSTRFGATGFGVELLANAVLRT